MFCKKNSSTCSFWKKGTGLLHSLVDGHPEVSTLPSIYFSEYFNGSNWEKIISDGWEKIPDHIISIYSVLFDATSATPIETKGNFISNIGIKEGMANLGELRNDVLRVDKALFRSELIRLMNYYVELTPFVLFQLIHAAYNTAIKDFNKKSLLFYHIHNPSAYAQLNFANFAQDARWVVMVREPLQSCESWIRKPFSDGDYSKIVNCIVTMLYDIDDIIYHNQNSIGVRLEDLKNFPRKTIRTLCKWIGINEEESLYTMTAQGKKWWGDPSSRDYKKDGMDAFGKTSILRNVGSIFSENDQFILRTLFYPFSVRFGYRSEESEVFKAHLHAIRPMLEVLFDFEVNIISRNSTHPKNFKASGDYLYFRSALIERWEALNKHGTYLKLINPLRI